VLRAFSHGQIFGESYGNGPVRVVWLHGWGRSHRDFVAAASALADAGIASVALDLPGFGASPAPLEAGGARTYAQLVAPVLRELSDDPVVLVGHSFGGRIATVLAADVASAVDGLVLTGVPLLRSASGGRAAWQFRLVRRLRGWGVLSEARLEAARQKYGSADYRQAQGVMRQVLVASVNESYDDELRRIAQPVAMVWGDLDTAATLAMAQRALALVPGPGERSLVHDAACTHFLPLERPDLLVDAVKGMVA
jgi:pimeloyl-ACP methyl ester carboxylesterase